MASSVSPLFGEKSKPQLLCAKTDVKYNTQSALHILNVQASENDERNIFFDRFVTGGLKNVLEQKNIQVLPILLANLKVTLNKRELKF